MNDGRAQHQHHRCRRWAFPSGNDFLPATRVALSHDDGVDEHHTHPSAGWMTAMWLLPRVRLRSQDKFVSMRPGSLAEDDDYVMTTVSVKSIDQILPFCHTRQHLYCRSVRWEVDRYMRVEERRSRTTRNKVIYYMFKEIMLNVKHTGSCAICFQFVQCLATLFLSVGLCSFLSRIGWWLTVTTHVLSQTSTKCDARPRITYSSVRLSDGAGYANQHLICLKCHVL